MPSAYQQTLDRIATLLRQENLDPWRVVREIRARQHLATPQASAGLDRITSFLKFMSDAKTGRERNHWLTRACRELDALYRMEAAQERDLARRQLDAQRRRGDEDDA